MNNTFVHTGGRALLAVLFASAVLFLLPQPAKAISGVDADEIKVILEARKGKEWFVVKQVKTDEDGVIEAKNVPPGKYRLTIHEDDRRDGQVVAFRSRLVDDEYRSLDEETTVLSYVYVGGTKIRLPDNMTDDEGWMESEGYTHGTEFEFDVRGDGEMSKKEGKPRIKIFAKIDDSEWFHAGTERIKNGVIKVDNILPGKYKYRSKKKDRNDPALRQPFTIKGTFYDEDGQLAKNEKIKMYGYFYGIKHKIGEFRTDSDGELSIPGAMDGMKVRLKY